MLFFPVEHFHFGRPKTNFSGFEKREKKVPTSFGNFSSFHFQFSTFPFTTFLLFFSIFTPFFLFSLPLSPGRSAEISPVRSLGGALCLLRCYATDLRPRKKRKKRKEKKKKKKKGLSHKPAPIIRPIWTHFCRIALRTEPNFCFVFIYLFLFLFLFLSCQEKNKKWAAKQRKKSEKSGPKTR